jgi:hypothetical protein
VTDIDKEAGRTVAQDWRAIHPPSHAQRSMNDVEIIFDNGASLVAAAG